MLVPRSIMALRALHHHSPIPSLAPLLLPQLSSRSFTTSQPLSKKYKPQNLYDVDGFAPPKSGWRKVEKRERALQLKMEARDRRREASTPPGLIPRHERELFDPSVPFGVKRYTPAGPDDPWPDKVRLPRRRLPDPEPEPAPALVRRNPKAEHLRFRANRLESTARRFIRDQGWDVAPSDPTAIFQYVKPSSIPPTKVGLEDSPLDWTERPSVVEIRSFNPIWRDSDELRRAKQADRDRDREFRKVVGWAPLKKKTPGSLKRRATETAVPSGELRSTVMDAAEDMGMLLAALKGDGEMTGFASGGEEADEGRTQEKRSKTTPPSSRTNAFGTSQRRTISTDSRSRPRSSPSDLTSRPTTDANTLSPEIPSPSSSPRATTDRWEPKKRLSIPAMAGLRALHAQDPEQFSIPALSLKFGISYEAVRRILKSNFRERQAAAGGGGAWGHAAERTAGDGEEGLVMDGRGAGMRRGPKPAGSWGTGKERKERSIVGTKWDASPWTSPAKSPVKAIERAFKKR